MVPAVTPADSPQAVYSKPEILPNKSLDNVKVISPFLSDTVFNPELTVALISMVAVLSKGTVILDCANNISSGITTSTESSPTTLPLYTNCAVAVPTLPLDTNTPFSMVPIEESANCQTTSAGTSAGPPAESAPVALNVTVEPGVTYVLSVLTVAWSNFPSATALEITNNPPRVAL